MKRLLQDSGLQPLSKQEIRCKELTEYLRDAERFADERQGKVAFMMVDTVYDQLEPGDLPLINRFLHKLGSTQQLSELDGEYHHYRVARGPEEKLSR